MKFQKLEKPILTRWRLVGACACNFKKSMRVWRKIFRGICNSAPSEITAYKIASCNLNLMDNNAILNDLELICAFHTFFLLPHFKWLQNGDTEVQTPSFISQHIKIRYFLMLTDLESTDNGKWKDNVIFDDCKPSCDELEESNKITREKIDALLSYVKESLVTHFKPWTGDLAFLFLFSNQPTAKCTAWLMIGSEIQEEEETVYCEYHKRSINVKEYSIFLQK